MPYFWLIIYFGCVCLAVLGGWVIILARQDCEPRHELEPVEYLATLAPLPDAGELWEPRAAPDVPMPVERLGVALSAVRHPCYQYAARLAAMSWLSHKTLQRNYDMLAFATVAQSYYRMGASYAG